MGTFGFLLTQLWGGKKEDLVRFHTKPYLEKKGGGSYRRLDIFRREDDREMITVIIIISLWFFCVCTFLVYVFLPPLCVCVSVVFEPGIFLITKETRKLASRTRGVVLLGPLGSHPPLR